MFRIPSFSSAILVIVIIIITIIIIHHYDSRVLQALAPLDGTKSSTLATTFAHLRSCIKLDHTNPNPNRHQ